MVPSGPHRPSNMCVDTCDNPDVCRNLYDAWLLDHGEWVTLNQLRSGALFETRDGIRAVKSEYLNGAGDQTQCVLLASGEYATFADRGATLVREVPVK